MLTSIKSVFEQFKIYFVIVVFALVFGSGVYVSHLYYSDKLSNQIVKTQEAENKLSVALANVTIKYIQGKDQIVYKNIIRTKEIPTYVPIDTTKPNNCVTNGFIEVHNAAVDSRDLKLMTQSEIEVASSSVNMQKLAKVISSNYSACNKYILQIEALQDTVKLFKETYGAE